MAEKKEVKKSAKLGREVGEKMFENMCEELGLDTDEYKNTDEGESSKNKLVHAFCTGALEYDEFVFTQNLKTPIQVGGKLVTTITIVEPDSTQLRSMAIIKKKNDDVGKALAVLGEVTGLGLQVVGLLKSRDSMISVAVISLFL